MSESTSSHKANSAEVFAKYLGVPLGIVKDSGNYYIVDGDMLFKKEDWPMTVRRQVTYAPTLYVPIHHGEGLISPENRGDVKIFISVETNLHPQSVIDRYKSAVRAAISNFNTLIPNTSIRMREVFDSSLSDIKVRLVDEGDNGQGGFAIFPTFNGKPSEYVTLNLYYQNNFNTIAKATQLTTHELGHAIGLGHTNTQYEQQAGPVFYRHIPGTAPLGDDPDPNSFILGGTYAGGLSGWSQSLGNPTGIGFTYYDKAAIEYLYPLSSSINISSVDDTEVAYQVKFIKMFSGTVVYSGILYPGTPSYQAYSVPYGVYNIVATPQGPISTPVELLLNYSSYVGTSFSLTNVNISTPKTLINLQVPSPCLFTAAEGFGIMSSNCQLNLQDETVEGYLAWDKQYIPNQTQMYSGTSYLVAKLPCNRPSETKGFSYNENGRTWYVSLEPNGDVWVVFTGPDFGPYESAYSSTFTFSYTL